MSQDLKRPLLFNVQRTKNPPIALVNQRESLVLRQRQEERLDDGYEDEEGIIKRARGLPSNLPAGALPVIRSPRPEKRTYVLSPTKTPSYFRWKAKPLPDALVPRNQRPVAPPRSGPHLASPSPRLSAKWNQSPPTTPNLLDLQQMGPSLFEVARSGGADAINDDNDPARRRMSDLFAPTPPPMQATQPPFQASQRRDSTTPALKDSNLFEYSEAPQAPATVDVDASNAAGTESPAKSVASAPVATATGQDRPSERRTSSTSTTRRSSAAAPAPPVPALLETQPDPATVRDEANVQENDSEEVLAAPIEISGSGQTAAPEKMIAQHVLRGKFLRRYLHANNLTRKLKETEQALRSAALLGGLPTLKGGGSLFSRSFVTKAQVAEPPKQFLVEDLLGEEASAMLTEQLPVLRRLSSIDKAINKTVKRIRRLSGIEDPAGTKATPRANVVPANTQPRSKFQGLKAIGEGQQLGPESRSRYEGLEIGGRGSPRECMDDDDDQDGDGDDSNGSKMDPSSAHMLRICQHVIAKRAIKSFLRQEMSVITIIEIALRDEASLQPKWVAQKAQAGQSSSRPPSASSTAGASDDPSVESHRVAIKNMNADVLEALAVYLRVGDQHMCFEELFAAAMAAERGKLWKRAILLASACVVIDREFVLGVLLRARCCRRLGLWTQAVKDLSHAILLRPEEYKLVLLRSCLHVKMSDLENALVDVNRALVFHPKSIDALLLRADIFHRQNAIGASLQDLTTALLYDPSCWRAYYDRATIRIRAIEGDENSLNYHWEHMKYEKLLASIIEDYVNAVRKGCQMVEVVETIGDLSIRLLEFTGDNNVLRQVVNNLSHLLQILAHDHRRSFLVNATPNPAALHGGRSPSIANASAAAAAALAASQGGTGSAIEQERALELNRELLVAAIHAQRGRLFVILNDRQAALADFDHAVVTEYHYPVAHFYRGAFATLTSKDKDEEATRANLQHLNRCISLDPTIAGAYTVRGAHYLRDLKFNNALQDFKAAVATDPTLYEVWLQIALIYLNHYHDCEECIKACFSALTNDSCLARALYLRAEAFTRQGNTKAALRDYGRLTMAQPDDRWAQLMRGRLLLQMKLARPALYAFIQFMELGAYAHERNGTGGGAADKRAHMLCGRAYKILSRFQQAVDQFQRAVSLNPTSENLVLLSESLHSMGDTENSLRVSERVINADPGGYKGYVRRAQLLVSIGQFQNAMAEYDKALFLAPKEGQVYYERGIVQMQLYLRWRVAHQLNFEDKKHAAGTASAAAAPPKKKTKRSPFEPRIPAIEVEATLGTDQINDEKIVLQQMKASYVGAIGDFCKCIRLEPNMADPYVDRAELYILGEDYDKAFHDFETAVERNPRCVRAYVNLGVLKCQFAAFAAAIADFDHAIRYEAHHTLALFNRAVSYQKLQLWRHAERSYSACIEITGVGRDVDAHRNRAIARCHISKFDNALSDFDEVRQSAPDDDQLHGGLGYVLLQLGRYEDAARCFATYGRLNRDTFADSGNAYFNLGSTQSHLDQKKYATYLKTALRFYLRAARLAPSNLDLRLNIANCLRRMDEPRRAITQCDSIYNAKPLHHACLESKALAYYQMHRLDEAVEWMNAAIRTCVASSSALENIFYAFASASIHRNALERKTVSSNNSSRGGSSSQQQLQLQRTPSPDKSTSMADAMSAQLQGLREQRLKPDGSDRAATGPGGATEIVLTGSSKQMLSLYMMNRGILHEKLGRWDDAVRDYKDAVHFDPMSVNALLCMATLMLVQGKHAASQATFEKALALDSKNGLAHLNLGVVFMCMDSLDEALLHFDAAIAELPSCSYAYANKAVALARSGDLRRAEDDFKRAIEELPSRKEYYLARGKIIAQQKRLQDAMVDFSTALFLGYEGKL